MGNQITVITAAEVAALAGTDAWLSSGAPVGKRLIGGYAVLDAQFTAGTTMIIGDTAGATGPVPSSQPLSPFAVDVAADPAGSIYYFNSLNRSSNAEAVVGISNAGGLNTIVAGQITVITAYED